MSLTEKRVFSSKSQPTPSSQRIILHTYFIVEFKPQFFFLNLVQEGKKQKIQMQFRDTQSPPRQGL